MIVINNLEDSVSTVGTIKVSNIIPWNSLKEDELDPERSGFDLDLIQSEPIRNEQNSPSNGHILPFFDFLIENK